MVPYTVIRRWAVGEASDLVRGERSVRVIHRIRLYLDSSYSLIATFLFLEVAAPWWFFAYCWIFSTIMPNVFYGSGVKI